MNDVTQILSDIERGDPRAASQLLPIVYDELRRLAAQRLAGENVGHTLQPTALVHEAYLKLVVRPRTGNDDEPGWQNRAHFFAAAAEAMRHILIDSARRKKAAKRGGGQQRFDVEDRDVPIEAPVPPEELIALDEALTRLAEEDPEAAKIVQLHFFAGLPIEQVAEAMNMSRATAYRQWGYARAWLRCAIGGESGETKS